MTEWTQFEADSLDYLCSNYAGSFIGEGKSNSTTPDIYVETGRSRFYIEVKESTAQAGQFVLLPDNAKHEFVFSTRNKTRQDKSTEVIIQHMNNNFARYSAAGTAGQYINIDKDVFYNWIVKYYAGKNVKYFMTKGSNYIIFPVCKLKNYFDVSGIYRVKRSGSSSVPAKYHQDVMTTLKAEYNGVTTEIKDKKLFVYSDSYIDEVQFNVGVYTYYLSKKEAGRYEVRQLANTCNANVIFPISLQAGQDSADLQAFRNEFR